MVNVRCDTVLNLCVTAALHMNHSRNWSRLGKLQCKRLFIYSTLPAKNWKYRHLIKSYFQNAFCMRFVRLQLLFVLFHISFHHKIWTIYDCCKFRVLHMVTKLFTFCLVNKQTRVQKCSKRNVCLIVMLIGFEIKLRV